MGHEHHFLSRLDRVSLPHVELALSIYRDHELLRFVLGKARLAEGAPRVAISLDDPEQGPFIIVTRDGHFVTCLGEGMSPGEWPILTRGRFDGLAAQMSEQRAREAARDKLIGANGKTVKLLTRIYEAGRDLSREEFMAAASLQPILQKKFLTLTIEAASDLDDAREGLLRVLRRTDKLRPYYRPLLLTYWHTFWAIGHLAMLATMNGAEVFEGLPEVRDLKVPAVSLCTIDQGISALAIRGAWGAGKLGKAVLPKYKHLLGTAAIPMEQLDAVLALTVIGLRHSRLRAEARKAIAAPRAFAESPLGGYMRDYHAPLVKLSDVAFDQPDEMTALHEQAGGDLLSRLTRERPPGSPHRYVSAEEVPVDLALTAGVNHQLEFLAEPQNISSLFCMLPWLARVEPEKLYFPAEVIEAIRTPWSPEQTISLLRGRREILSGEVKREGPRGRGGVRAGAGRSTSAAVKREPTQRRPRPRRPRIARVGR